MKDPIFAQVLNTLSAKEQKDFCRFLDYDRPQRLPDCRLVLERAIHLLRQNRLPSPTLLLQGLPTIDAEELRHISSYLHTCIRRYVAIRQVESEVDQQSIALLRHLNSHNLDKLVEKEAQKILKRVRASSTRSASYYNTMSAVYRELYIARSRQGRRGDMKIIEWRKHFVQYTTIELAQQLALQATYNVYNQDMDAALDLEVTSLLDTCSLNPAATFYQLITDLLSDTTSDSPAYYPIKEQLINDHAAFDDQELKTIVLLIINYCIRQINKGQQQYLSECLHWYGWGLKLGVLLEHGAMSIFTYKNMISLAVKSDAIDQGLEVLEQYKGRLRKDVAEAAYAFNRGRLLFHDRQYTEAMRLLQQTTPPTILDGLDTRRMLLRMYYEEGSLDLLDNHLASFGAFLHRHKELGYHKTHYLHLVKYTGRLIRTRDRSKKDSLLREIRKKDNIADRDWLESMLQKR